MSIDWGTMFTIFLAILLAELVSDALKRGQKETTSVSAPQSKPAKPLTAADFVRTHFPNAVTV